jgi:uncharacterized protein
MEHWADRQRGEPLDYITMLRFNHDRLGLPRELPGTGAIAKALIDSGAPVNGRPGDKETPLITAASYGDAEVAKVLIDAGADIDAVSAPDSGGVPSGTALDHAAVFGMTDVIDVLVAAGTPVNQADAEWGRLPMHTAAGNGRTASVQRLLAHGADPNLRDPQHHRTPLEECQPADNLAHREIEAILRPLTRNDTPGNQP